jgi:hypothetical protein
MGVAAVRLALAECLILQAHLLGCVGVVVREFGPIASVEPEAQFGRVEEVAMILPWREAPVTIQVCVLDRLAPGWAFPTSSTTTVTATAGVASAAAVIFPKS